MADETLRGKVTMDHGHLPKDVWMTTWGELWSGLPGGCPHIWHCLPRPGIARAFDLCLAHLLPQQGGAAGGLRLGSRLRSIHQSRLSRSPGLENAQLVVGLGDTLGLVSAGWGDSEEWR